MGRETREAIHHTDAGGPTLLPVAEPGRGERTGTTKLLPRPTDPDYLYRAKVVQVIDGDTLDLHIDVGSR